MNETFRLPRYNNFNQDTDVMLPIILYLDKTGTDVLQRYSLEPMLFTTAALNRESRENRRFWRHLGFIPSFKSMEDSKDSLDFYHQCLTVILNGLKQAQENPPNNICCSKASPAKTQAERRWQYLRFPWYQRIIPYSFLGVYIVLSFLL